MPGRRLTPGATRVPPTRALLLALALLGAPACTLVAPAIPCLPGAGTVQPSVIVAGQARLPVALAQAGASAAYAREVAVSKGEVFLADAAGRALPGLNVLTTDVGAFRLNRVPPGQALVIAVRAKTATGEPLLLRGLLRTGQTGADVQVNAATTVATMALLEGQRGAVGDFDQASYDALVAKVYQRLQTVSDLDLRDEQAVIARFKTWADADPTIRALYERLRAEVTRPTVSLEDQIKAIQAAQGLPTPPPGSPKPSADPAASPGAGPTASPSGTPVTPAGGPAATPTPAATAVPADAAVTTIAGDAPGFADGAGGAGGPARLNGPGGLAFDPRATAPTLYVADTGNNRIRKVDLTDPARPVVSTVAGTGVPGQADGAGDVAQFDVPFGLAFDNEGMLLVVDSQGASVRKVDVRAAAHPVTTAWRPSGTARFNNPTGIALDPQSGAVYVSDYLDHAVRRIAPGDPAVPPSRLVAADPTTPGGLLGPMGLAVDPNHFLWVADSGKGLIRTVAADGTVATFAGREARGGDVTYAEGLGAAARFLRPTGLALHPAGYLVVADAGNHRIRKVGADGQTALIAGRERGRADGRLGEATFDGPTWVAVSPDGSIYVADTGNHRIRRLVVS